MEIYLNYIYAMVKTDTR